MNTSKTQKSKTHKTKKYQKHKKVVMSLHKYTRKQKANIVTQLFDATKDDAINDFKLLQTIGCDSKRQFSKVGNTAVNYFTLEERLETTGNKGYNFYDVWKNRAKITREYPYIKKLLQHYEKNYASYPTIRVWKRVFDIYYGSIAIFRPLQAMEVYCRFKTTSVLDFTMGWGGRLIGACALNIKKYIGIDKNPHLKEHYRKMVAMLAPLSDTKVSLYFQDALAFDYSKIDYDMVLTSPPYYNIEIYRDTQQNNKNNKSKDEWNREFYEPLIQNTFTHLKRGGVYCLNLPTEIYDTVAKHVLGPATEKIHMKKFKRNTNGKNKEYIYVWHKK